MKQEERRLIDCLLESLLETHFSSKQEMAQALGVSEEQLDTYVSYEILDQILHYCVRNALPMGNMLDKLVN